jgi:hypothetical protein
MSWGCTNQVTTRKRIDPMSLLGYIAVGLFAITVSCLLAAAGTYIAIGWIPFCDRLAMIGAFSAFAGLVLRMET